MMSNTIELGPLLGIEENEIYTVCLLLKGETKDLKLKINGDTADEFLDAKFTVSPYENYYFFRFEIEKKGNINGRITYSFTDQNDEKLKDRNSKDFWSFNQNIKSKIPDVAFVSCNGMHSMYPNQIPIDNYRGWESLKAESPDLLFLTGDQVYADTVFEKCPHFKKYYFENVPFSKELDQELDFFYLQLYIDSWSNPYLSKVLATIPNIMTWDDHDIIDGFGSHRDSIADKLDILYKYAAKYYELFQIRSKSNTTLINKPNAIGRNDYSCILQFRQYLFVMPDTRSFRTKTQILNSLQYADLLNISNRKIQINSILCFILPVPIAHLDFTRVLEKVSAFVEKLLNFKKQNLINSDDTIDHWDHYAHKEEQKQLLDIMFKVADDLNPSNLVIVSGDVHSAGAAKITAKINEKNKFATQLITSPIVNKPPSGFERLITILSWPVKIIDNFVCELKHFGAIKQKLFYKRNFLILKIDGYLKAFLFIENSPTNWTNHISGKYLVRTINNFEHSRTHSRGFWYKVSYGYNMILKILKS